MSTKKSYLSDCVCYSKVISMDAWFKQNIVVIDRPTRKKEKKEEPTQIGGITTSSVVYTPRTLNRYDLFEY